MCIKTILKNIATYLIILITWTVIFAFIHGEINVFLWSITARLFLIILTFLGFFKEEIQKIINEIL